MTVIKSSVRIAKLPDMVYAFLEDLNNHQQLMPDNIYNWSSTRDEARFRIQNMAKLAIGVNSRIPNTEITAIPIEEAPFNLELKWTLTEVSAGETEAEFSITADLNPMLKMLASGPLQKLADHETASLKRVLEVH